MINRTNLKNYTIACLLLSISIGIIYLKPIYWIVGSIEEGVNSWGKLIIIIAIGTMFLPHRLIKILGLALISIFNLLPAILWLTLSPLTDHPQYVVSIYTYLVFGMIHLSVTIFSAILAYMNFKTSK